VPSEDLIRKFESLADQAKAVSKESRPLLEAVRQFPGLAWIKRYDPHTSKYVMVVLSQQYILRILGGKMEDYLGKTDFDVWDYDTALLFFENDEMTRKGERNATQIIEEPWESARTGQKGTFRGYKWMFEVEGHVYVVGMGAA
jgi:hypothetical protein